jgi:hypothetical protein
VTALPASPWGAGIASPIRTSPKKVAKRSTKQVVVRKSEKQVVVRKSDRPTVDRRAVKAVHPSNALSVVPVRQPSNRIRKADLNHSANAKLRSRSNAIQTRTATPVDAIEVTRRVRTSEVISISDASVVR